MKKILVPFIIVCLVFSNCITSHAMNVSQFIIRSQSSVQADVTTIVGNTLNSTVFPDLDSSYNNNGYDYIEQMLACINLFDVSLLNDYDYYIISGQWMSGSGMSEAWKLYIYAFNSNNQPFAVSKDYNGSHFSISLFGSYGSQVGKYWECSYNSSEAAYGTGWTSGSYFSFLDNNDCQNDYGYTSCGKYVYDANFPVLSEKEIDTFRGQNSVNYFVTNGGYSSCTDIFANTYGYDVSGNLVQGGVLVPEVESNVNHMYFDSCDIGFCMPYGIMNTRNFGGSYVYVRYVVDDWIVNHINDYKINVHMTATIDNHTYNGGSTISLDRDGCITIPFINFDWPITTYGYQSMITNTEIEQNFCKSYLYSMSNTTFSNVKNKYNFVNSWAQLNTGKYLFSVFNDEFQGIVQDISTANFDFNRFNPYNILLSVKLVDSEGNESGVVSRRFDLVTGGDTSEDNSGLVNDNPFEPDPDNSDFTPSVPDGNNSTFPTIIINNGGTWTGTSTIAFDPGYKELKYDIDQDPDGNFTQYLAPFENNEAGNFVFSFFNKMPIPITIVFIGIGI